MSQLVEGNQDNFKWGITLDAVSNDSDSTVFRSFSYQRVEYSLFDCIYLYHEGGKETDIGILVKIWRNKLGGKRGKVLWFFRPMDIYQHLRDYEPSWNELFLASGQGKGVANIIPLEAIVGKCNVVCTAKDIKNTMPSKSDLRKADYFFSHTFNVVDLKISPKFPDSIETIKVERLFKWNRDKLKANGECRIALAAEKHINLKYVSSYEDSKHCNRDKPITDGIPNKCEEFERHTSEAQPLKKRKILVVAEANSQSSPQDIRRWFTNLPWEERLKEAHEHRAIVHLVNFDPSYTSLDVQEIIASAFKLTSYAKIIKGGYCCKPLYGEALVIFKTKDDADIVINGLQQKCLVVGEGRPLIACEFSLNDPSRTYNFPGHLIMDCSLKVKLNKRKVVFTSHCTQANTIEHEMAIQWRVLQQKSNLWWEALREEQACEISDCLRQMTKNSQLVEYTVASEEVTPPESLVNAIHGAAPLPASV